MNARRFAAVLVLVLGALASAGQVLQLNDGKAIAGRVVTLDDAGVTFAPESGGEMRVTWDLVVPMSRFELWEASLPADDAKSRVALGKWALGAELFFHARRELVKAKGLGYSGAEKLDELIAQVNRDEADAALGEADALIASGDLDKALDRLRLALKIAPPGPEAERMRERADDLVRRIERREELEREQDTAKKKAEKEGRLKEWIEKNLADARKLAKEGADRSAAGFVELAKGNQTRARDALGDAESSLQGARVVLKRVKKATGAGETADACDQEMKDCDRRTVEVLVRWGRMEVENKAWKRASAIVDRGLKIDPVDRELLELRQTIDTNWIRRKASEVTNAKPRESD
jgi:tetratricopeptide (TPR) repeat protein